MVALQYLSATVRVESRLLLPIVRTQASKSQIIRPIGCTARRGSTIMIPTLALILLLLVAVPHGGCLAGN